MTKKDRSFFGPSQWEKAIFVNNRARAPHPPQPTIWVSKASQGPPNRCTITRDGGTLFPRYTQFLGPVVGFDKKRSKLFLPRNILAGRPSSSAPTYPQSPDPGPIPLVGGPHQMGGRATSAGLNTLPSRPQPHIIICLLACLLACLFLLFLLRFPLLVSGSPT